MSTPFALFSTVMHPRRLNGIASTSESHLPTLLQGDDQESFNTNVPSVFSTGRGLMKKFTSGADLAKDMGISEKQLKATFDDYNQIASGKKKDPFGKKFFDDDNWKMDDYFHVAVSNAVAHYRLLTIH